MPPLDFIIFLKFLLNLKNSVAWRDVFSTCLLASVWKSRWGHVGKEKVTVSWWALGIPWKFLARAIVLCHVTFVTHQPRPTWGCLKHCTTYSWEQVRFPGKDKGSRGVFDLWIPVCPQYPWFVLPDLHYSCTTWMFSCYYPWIQQKQGFFFSTLLLFSKKFFPESAISSLPEDKSSISGRCHNFILAFG